MVTATAMQNNSTLTQNSGTTNSAEYEIISHIRLTEQILALSGMDLCILKFVI